MPVCSAGPLADGSTQVPTSQRVDEQDDQENHLQQPRQCKHIHTLGELAKARKSSQHRPGFRLAAPASTATSGESSQLVSSPLVCWTPIRQHVTSPLVFDKHYHSLALHDKSVIQPLHHHHQQKKRFRFSKRILDAHEKWQSPCLHCMYQWYSTTTIIIKRQSGPMFWTVPWSSYHT